MTRFAQHCFQNSCLQTRRQFLRTVAVGTSISLSPGLLLGQSQGRVITVAGNGQAGYEEEPRGGSVATESPINNPYGVVPGPDGALYFCEVDTGRIRRLDVGRNRLSTIAGTGEPGYRPESRRPMETPFSTLAK